MAQHANQQAVAGLGGECTLDFYKVLGVARDATAAEVRKSYHVQALKWHPDKAGDGDEAKQRFQAISEAHDILSDDVARKRYDYLLAQLTAAADAAKRQKQQKQQEWQQQWQQQQPRRPQPQQQPRQQSPPQRPHQHQRTGYPDQGRVQQQRYPAAWQQHAPPPAAATTAAEARAREEERMSRPTAAEIHPEGFNQTSFIAYLGDLRALTTLWWGGRALKPEVNDIDWGRLPDAAQRIKLTFSADYHAPPKFGGHGSRRELDLRETPAQQRLQDFFEQQLFRALGSSVRAAFRLVVPGPHQSKRLVGDGHFPFQFRVRMEGEAASMLGCFSSLRSSRFASKDCKLM
eukprot:gnl/TRDRNA2_/TRDRNA2_200005_c0_seq1.p1 gnl/TRDRNA2_/TRDRNA2_200005_c0~~gnl/TRDRNA2_/TRDRNA2_200005_c0_seq1.p1  ORF type:complete len:346 (+),score=69.35 gnl/TRDRNA2_/TRDRNA2_200005_c0_seq1:156-1193(+)